MEPSETTNAIEPAQTPAVCPACGAALAERADYCKRCGWRRHHPAAANSANGRGFRWTFGLDSLFLWTTLIAVLLGAAKIEPWLGVVLAAIAMPSALNAAAIASRRRYKSGRGMCTLDKVGAFVISAAAIMLIGVAMLITAGVTALIAAASMNVTDELSRTACLLIGLITFVGAAVGIAVLAYTAFRGIWRGMT